MRFSRTGFNSRPSCDGRRLLLSNDGPQSQVSIHARRVTGDQQSQVTTLLKRVVSIHARRVTGDILGVPHIHRRCVSIHARRVTGDGLESSEDIQGIQFQFTPVV